MYYKAAVLSLTIMVESITLPTAFGLGITYVWRGALTGALAWHLEKSKVQRKQRA